MIFSDIFIAQDSFKTVISDSDREMVCNRGYYRPEIEELSGNELCQVVDSFEYLQHYAKNLTKSPEVDDPSDHELTNYEVSKKL